MNRYATTKILKTASYSNNNTTVGTQYYATTRYPEIPLDASDIYVITDFGDRLDLLANQFYKDVSLYWIIAVANPNETTLGSINVAAGTQLRIPTDTFSIIQRFNDINQK
tara:strand:+ start:9798 stop:10127 length:330 start_codon:yes stop_codon:yes gene_type:complete